MFLVGDGQETAQPVFLYANIVTAVKICYKRKSRSGAAACHETGTCAASSHAKRHAIAAKGALLQCERTPLAAQKGLCCSAEGTLLQRKRGLLATKRDPPATENGRFGEKFIAHFPREPPYAPRSQPLAAARPKLAKKRAADFLADFPRVLSDKNANIVQATHSKQDLTEMYGEMRDVADL